MHYVAAIISVVCWNNSNKPHPREISKKSRSRDTRFSRKAREKSARVLRKIHCWFMVHARSHFNWDINFRRECPWSESRSNFIMECNGGGVDKTPGDVSSGPATFLLYFTLIFRPCIFANRILIAKQVFLHEQNTEAQHAWCKLNAKIRYFRRN